VPFLCPLLGADNNRTLSRSEMRGSPRARLWPAVAVSSSAASSASSIAVEIRDAADRITPADPQRYRKTCNTAGLDIPVSSSYS
jgi:hypothetical protein